MGLRELLLILALGLPTGDRLLGLAIERSATGNLVRHVDRPREVAPPSQLLRLLQNRLVLSLFQLRSPSGHPTTGIGSQRAFRFNALGLGDRLGPTPLAGQGFRLIQQGAIAQFLNLTAPVGNFPPRQGRQTAGVRNFLSLGNGVGQVYQCARLG